VTPDTRNVGAETMCSGKEFQTWAAATGKAYVTRIATSSTVLMTSRIGSLIEY